MEQCNAMTAAGKRCSAKSIIDGYCVLHFKKVYGVTDDRTAEQRERY